MKKTLIILLSLFTIYACGNKCVDCKESIETTIEKDDSLMLNAVFPAPDGYRGLYESLDDFRNRPDSITVATEDYDDIWVQAHPLTAGDELMGMFERQTPLGQILQATGVITAILLAAFIILWLLMVPVRGIFNHELKTLARSCRPPVYHGDTPDRVRGILNREYETIDKKDEEKPENKSKHKD